MKRLAIALLLISASFTIFAKTTDRKAIQKEKIMSLVSEYSGKDGFEVVKIGSLGTSALKGVMRIAAAADNDEDMKQAMKLMKGITKMAIVDYEDCDARTRNAFNSRLNALLGESGLLMEAKDGDDTMKIYGVVDEEGGKIQDFVMYAPKDCALICIFGSIPMDSIMEVAGMVK